jgi:CHAT domain-containing protein
MAEFYKNLKTMSRAEALQRAQLVMMKKYDNPYYWGAFVLYGDYR